MGDGNFLLIDKRKKLRLFEEGRYDDTKSNGL